MYREAKQLKKLALSPAVFLATLLPISAFAQEAQRWETNLSPGITELGHEVYDLHMLIFWLCVVVSIAVFGFMFYSLVAYRKSNGHEPATFHEHTGVEIAWTIVPTLILIAMAIPASKTLIEVYNTDDPDLSVLVTGYQWKWKYEYLLEDGEKVAFFSTLKTPRDEINNIDKKNEHYLLEVDNALYLPINKKTRFLITANDVIHSWWVPALSIKKDAIPGFINESWAKPLELGTYRGQCAELCGKDHGFMPIVVEIVEQETFDSWIAEKQVAAAELAQLIQQEKSMDELLSRGKEVYDASCAACHGANGEGGVGKPIAGSAIVTGALDGHLSVTVKGVPGTAMQAFGSQLNEIDLAAVVTYQRNAFGNNMGDKVQPVDVYNFKTK
jgi:cytochrome c oxidase subunit 2